MLYRTSIGGFTTPESQPHSIPLDQIAAAVSGGQLAVLSALRQLASEEQVPVYLVGGAVRDYVLGLPTRDLDFVVVGNATIVATELANNLSGTVTVHQRFGTATVEIDGDRVDIVTARNMRVGSSVKLSECRIAIEPFAKSCSPPWGSITFGLSPDSGNAIALIEKSRRAKS